MKLITKISIRYFINSLLLFIVFSSILFFAIVKFIRHETKEEMDNTSLRVVKNIETGIDTNFPPYIETRKQEHKREGEENIYSETVLYNPAEKKSKPFQQLASYHVINGDNYEIIVRISLVDKNDLAETIGKVLAASLVILLISLFIINKQAANKILKPFYNNLNRLKSFSIKSDSDIVLQDSDVDEFREMNRALEELSFRARREYKLLKEFSENASHEIQTPLAVIKSTLDMIIQKNEIDEEFSRSIQIFYSNVDKLSNLTKSLLLLAKIGNGEYLGSAEFDLEPLLSRQVEDLAELTASKRINVISDYKCAVKLKMNELLSHIMISNLLSNAIKHNYSGGWIKIDLIKNSSIIENSGAALGKDPEKLLNRFEKDNAASDSSGLGLAIVKEICDLYGYSVKYTSVDKNHRVELLFNG